MQQREAEDNEDEADVERLRQLEDELESRQLELQDLRSQNSDLAAQLARQQVLQSTSASNQSVNQESLTWEERKQLILRQLDDEDEDQSSEAVVAKRLEVDQIISATQLEIERRDRGIQELQSIVQQQSSTRDGLAVGAAAIAQMVDSDELVDQERQKLRGHPAGVGREVEAGGD